MTNPAQTVRVVGRSSPRSSGGLVLAGLAANYIGTAGVALLSARQLGPAERGSFVLVLSSSSLTTLISGLGLGPVARRSLAVGEISSTRVWRILAILLPLQVILAESVTLALWDAGLFKMTVSSALLVAILAVATMLGIGSRDILIGSNMASRSALLDGLSGGMQLLLFGLLTLGGDLTFRTSIGAVAAGYLTQAAFARWASRGAASVPAIPLLALIRRGRHGLVQGVSQALVQRGDRILLGFAATAASVGYYSIASTAADYLCLIAVAAAQSDYFYSAVNFDASRHQMRRAKVLAVTVCVAVCMAVTAFWWVPSLFGRAYLTAVSSTRVMLLGSVLLASFFLDVQVLLSAGRLKAAAAVTSVGMIIALASDLVLYAFWSRSALSTAVGSVCGYLSLAVASAVIVSTQSRGRSREGRREP